MNLSLTQRSGLSLIEEMQLHQLPIKAVVFTCAQIGEFMRVIDMGVTWLVSMDKSRQVLVRCIHTVHQADKWLDRDLSMMQRGQVVRTLFVHLGGAMSGCRA